MKKEFLLGIDVGTTAVKGIIIDTSGTTYSLCSLEYTLETSSNQFCEIDAEIYWQKTSKVIKTLLKESGLSGQLIKALAISSQGETLIPVDKEGRPLRKAIVWIDGRSVKEAKEIEHHFGKETIYRITGQPEVVPTWPATKILWLKRNEPEIFRQTFKYLLVEDFLIYKLTGQFKSEESLLSSTLFFDIWQKTWWNSMLAYIGISPSQLPEILPSGTPIGRLLSSAQKATRLGEQTVVVAGAYDHPAGAIGAGNISTGVVSETTGTAMAMCVTLEQPVINPKLNLPCQCHAIPGKYFLLPYGQTAGMVLRWFRDHFSEKEIEQARKTNNDVYDLMTAKAAAVPPGCDGLTMLPHLMGTGSPEFDPGAKGIFAGITLHTGKGHFIRAIMEAVACMVKANIESLSKIKYEVKELRALGGGAKSPLWNQIKADMLGIPVITLKNKEAPALGAAILAGVGVGLFKNIEDGCRRTVKIDKTFKPNPGNFQIYNNVYQRYQQLYAISKKFWDSN